MGFSSPAEMAAPPSAWAEEGLLEPDPHAARAPTEDCMVTTRATPWLQWCSYKVVGGPFGIVPVSAQSISCRPWVGWLTSDSLSSSLAALNRG